MTENNAGLISDPRRQAALLYWQGFSVTQIAEMLSLKKPTVQSWKQREKWDAVAPISRIETSIEARVIQLVMKSKKEGQDFKEIDLLGRQIERLARVNRIWTPRVLQVLVRYGLRPYIRRR
jgi:uncharacterized protein YjcR